LKFNFLIRDKISFVGTRANVSGARLQILFVGALSLHHTEIHGSPHQFFFLFKVLYALQQTMEWQVPRRGARAPRSASHYLYCSSTIKKRVRHCTEIHGSPHQLLYFLKVLYALQQMTEWQVSGRGARAPRCCESLSVLQLTTTHCNTCVRC